MTFLKFSLESFDAIWLAGQSAIQISISDGLKLNSNDLAGKLHRKVTSLRLPRASIKVLLAPTPDRNIWLEAAELVADGYLDIYSSPRGWQETAREQASFVAAQDFLTGRANRMLGELQGDAIIPGDFFMVDTCPSPFKKLKRELPDPVLHKNGLYLPQPRLPNPLTPHKSDRPSEPISGRTTTKPWRWSRMSHLSESEGEEGVSEADRDARLA